MFGSKYAQRLIKLILISSLIDRRLDSDEASNENKDSHHAEKNYGSEDSNSHSEEDKQQEAVDVDGSSNNDKVKMIGKKVAHLQNQKVWMNLTIIKVPLKIMRMIIKA